MNPPLKSGSPRSGRFKIALLGLAFLIVAATLWYTHSIVGQLQERQKQVADLYARSLEYLANARTMEGDYSFVFDEVIRAIDFPIILTGRTNEPIHPLQNACKNIPLDSTLSETERVSFLKQLALEMDRQNPPIKVAYQDTIILNYVHYGESPLVTQLRWLPYIEISIVGLFILIGYISFSYVKRSEHSNIWVGMARETAHQLGTPISSMMGWIELLKGEETNPQVARILRDMESDVQRLQKIADRFSKIGSRPDLKEENLTEVIHGVIRYFERRIPHSGKRVELTLEPDTPVSAHINRELFEWVLENLIKNGLDAMENGEGRISVSITEHGDDVFIDVTDTGKGIDLLYKKDIFRPGFSTKARGWGLGLSLSQRIIEAYHKGKLFLKESRPGSGTTFRIKLQR